MMLVRFWVNHHLLDLTQRPVWRVVKDRSRSYVRKILEGDFRPTSQNIPLTSSERRSHVTLCKCMHVESCPHLFHMVTCERVPAELPDVRLACPVTSATPASPQKPALVRWGDGQSQEFDAVIFATHSDTTLSLLGDAAPKVVSPAPQQLHYTQRLVA